MREYRTAHEDLLAALPELRRPYERLIADWDDFDGKPPGQYTVFPDLLGTLLEVVLTLEEGTPGREKLLRRALDFAETLFGGECESLAIDAVGETLNRHPAGRRVAERLGGPRLQAWFAAHGGDGVRRDEIIDLWGVRAELAPRLPAMPLPAIPGISHPADHLALGSLAEARAVDDGAAAILSTFGTTRLYVVVRAGDVALDDAQLDRLAKDIAASLGGEDVQGNPGLRLRRIPFGERVWNMGAGHARLQAEPWVADALGAARTQLLDYITGRGGEPNLV